MTRAQLLALAVALSGLGTGIYFLRASDATVTTLPESFGNFEIVNRASCSVSACNDAECTAAKNVLRDAGSSDTTHFVECPVRIGAAARAFAVDAGVSFSASPYQQVKLKATRDPTTGALGIPVRDDGWPKFATATGIPGCLKRPTGAGTAACSFSDGGDQGDENQRLLGELVGAGCVAVPCGVFAGDAPP